MAQLAYKAYTEQTKPADFQFSLEGAGCCILIDLTPESVRIDFADGTTQYYAGSIGVHQYPPDTQPVSYTNIGPDCCFLSFEIKG